MYTILYHIDNKYIKVTKITLESECNNNIFDFLHNELRSGMK